MSNDLRDRVRKAINTAWAEGVPTVDLGIGPEDWMDEADAAITAVLTWLAEDADAHMAHVGYWTDPEGDYIETGLDDWIRAHISGPEVTE